MLLDRFARAGDKSQNRFLRAECRLSGAFYAHRCSFEAAKLFVYPSLLLRSQSYNASACTCAPEAIE